MGLFFEENIPFSFKEKTFLNIYSDSLLTQGQLWNQFCLSLIQEVTEKSRLQPLAGRNVFLNSQADSQIRRSLCS